MSRGHAYASGDAHAAHAALSPVSPTLSGVNCKRDRVAVDLSVSWRCRKGGCQRRRTRGACRTIACPPTLSGVNCKRDRVAVDLPVPRRCRKGGCKRRRSRGACRTIACPPTLSGVTANETALRSICLFLGVVGGHAYAGGDAHTAHQGALLHLLHSAADTQSHAETTWRTISSRANPQSSL